MASGGSSSSNSSQNMSTMGLGPLLGLSALGYQFTPRRGGIGVSRGGMTGGTSLGPAWLGGDQLGSLGGLLEGMQLGPAEQLAGSGVASNLALNQMFGANQGIGSLLQALGGAGTPTDIAPIQSAASRFLGNEYANIDQAMGQNFQSDQTAAKYRTAGDVASQLGTLEFQAGESAKDRQIASVAPGLAGYTQQLSNIMDTFGGLFGLEDASREAARSETAGGRTADILSWLAGLTGPVGNVGESKSDSWNFGMGCWVAAEYYGWYTPEWWNVRTWIMEGWNTVLGRLFRAFYLVHGPVVAQLVHTSEELHERLRPLFVWCEQRGREMNRGR